MDNLQCRYQHLKEVSDTIKYCTSMFKTDIQVRLHPWGDQGALEEPVTSGSKRPSARRQSLPGEHDTAWCLCWR